MKRSFLSRRGNEMKFIDDMYDSVNREDRPVTAPIDIPTAVRLIHEVQARLWLGDDEDAAQRHVEIVFEFGRVCGLADPAERRRIFKGWGVWLPESTAAANRIVGKLFQCIHDSGMRDERAKCCCVDISFRKAILDLR
jgi:hypothetical protein